MVEKFGEILKKLRKEHHLTQDELLARLPDERHQNYDLSEVSKWESGKRKPPEDVIEAFESVFSTPPGYLLEAAGYTKLAEYRRLIVQHDNSGRESKIFKPPPELELEKRGAFLEAIKWEALSDIVVRLQVSLSRISAKDWGVWQLPDAPWLLSAPYVSSEEHPAELNVRIDRGKLRVDLIIEEDKQFSLLMMRLEAVSPEFAKFREWKQRSLTELISSCQEICREIWHAAESRTGLRMTPFDPGYGFLQNVPLFTYEFALDNYGRENLPRLEVLPHDAYRCRLTPEGCPEYILAVGSEQEMMICREVTMFLCSWYTKDGRIGKIKEEETKVCRQAEPFKKALSRVLDHSVE